MVVVSRAGGSDERRSAVLERAHRADVDRAGHAAADEIRGLRLVDLDRGNDFRGEHFPAHVAIGLRRGDLAPVDRAHRQPRTEAAHRGQTLVAAVAGAVDAGQAHERFRDRDVRHLTDVVRGNDFGDVVAFFLGFDRVGETGADAGHDHLFERSGILGRVAADERAATDAEGDHRGHALAGPDSAVAHNSPSVVDRTRVESELNCLINRLILLKALCK